MIFHVKMDVHPPQAMPQAEFDRIKAAEKAYAEGLQRSGKWVHLWRIVGKYSNVSIFDVEGNDELQAILSGLPLFPYMTIEVTALARHPSAIGP